MKMLGILFLLYCCISSCCAKTGITLVESSAHHNIFTCWSNISTNNSRYTIFYNGNVLFDGPFPRGQVDREKFKINIGDKSTNLTVRLDEEDCGVKVRCLYGTENSEEEKIICKKPLGDRCTDSNECAVMNSICIEAVGNQTCQCISTHYNDSGICKIKKPLGDRCTDINQCADMNSTCIEAIGTQTCQCRSTHYNDSGICKIKKPLGDRCTDSNQCADMNSTCIEAIGNQTCQCRSTHYNDSGICQIKKPLGDRCTDSNQCADMNSKCKEAIGNQTCQCISTHYNDSGICQIRPDSGHGKGKIIIIVLGISVSVVVLCIVLRYYCYNRRRSEMQNANSRTNRADNETGEELDELKKHDVSQFEDPFSKTCKRSEVEPFLTC